jgi:hypothetical protein
MNGFRPKNALDDYGPHGIAGAEGTRITAEQGFA